MGTNVLNKDDIIMGTGILKVNGINVGQLKGDVIFTPSVEFKEFEAGIPKQIVKKKKIKEGATLKASLAEMNPENMGLALGTSNVTYTTGEVTVAAPEAIVFGSTAVQVKKNRHITDVIVKVEAVAAVLGTDYEIVNAASGKIKRIATSTVIELGNSATISYKYRKSAKITYGGGASIPEVPCQYVYTSPDGDQEITLDIYLGQINGGQPITFKEDDYTINDFELTCMADPDRPAGDQLCSWDYQYIFED